MMEYRTRIFPSRQGKKFSYSALAGTGTGAVAGIDSSNFKPDYSARDAASSRKKKIPRKFKRGQAYIKAVPKFKKNETILRPPVSKTRGELRVQNVPKEIMTPTQQAPPEPLERKTSGKILTRDANISDSESEFESKSKSESESESSGFSDEESQIPPNSANLKELILDPGAVIKEERPDTDHEENAICFHQFSNEATNIPNNVVPVPRPRDEVATKTDVPFKIIKTENSTNSSGNGGKAATWTTPAFTIKAVIHEPGIQHPSKQRAVKTKVREKQAENKKDNSSSPPRTGKAAPSKKSKVPKKIMSCPVCKIQLERGQLSGHLLTKHKDVDKPFSCDHCDQTWKTMHALNKHQISHSESKPYVCQLCDTRFKRHYSLLHHEYHMHHTTENPDSDADQVQDKFNRTRDCPSRSRRKRRLYSTALIQKEKGYRIGREGYRIGPEELPPFKCPEPNCPEEFPTPYTLQRHHSAAHQERPFVCQYCGGTYTTSTQLNVHLAGHTTVRPFVCDQCGATYKNSSHLNLHFRRYHNPEGHEEYKAYRRMIQKRARNQANKQTEAEGTHKRGGKGD